jgi:hypothetical protein
MTPATFGSWVNMAVSKNQNDLATPEKEWILKNVQIASDRAQLNMKDQFKFFFPPEEVPSDG